MTLVMISVAVPTLCWAQGIIIQPSNTAPIETTPGKVITVSFLILNNTSQSQRLEGEAFLPAGWHALMRRTRVELAPMQRDILLVSFSIPLEAAAGQYPFRYRLKSLTAIYLGVEASVPITILPIRSLELQFTDASRYVIAGDTLITQFTLVNKGNELTRIRLHTKVVGVDSAFVDSTLIRLKPNETRHIKAIAPTSHSISVKTRALLELYASSVTDTTIVAHASAVSDIIPRIDYVSSTIYRYPLLITIHPTGSDEAYRTQFELTSSAPLSDGGKDILSLLIRTPQTIEQSVLGYRDEYRAGYKSEKLDLYAGDQIYTLTQLTEFSRYGFGGGGRIVISPITVGGFYNKTRFYSPALEQYGGFLGARILNNLNISINTLQKKESVKSTIYSFRTLYQPFQSTGVDVEYGLSSNPQGNDHAFAGQFNVQSSFVNMDLRYINAGPLYSGYYRDIRSTAASITFYPWKLFHIEGYLRDERRNINLDTLQYIAPRDRYYEAGLGYSDLVSVRYRVTKREDLLPVSKYSQVDHMYQFSSGYNFSWLNISVNADIGWVEDRLMGKNEPYSRYYANAGFRILDSHNLNFTVEYDKQVNVETDEEQKQQSASLFLLSQLSDKTRFTLNVYGSRAISSSTQTYTIIDFAIEHTFSFGHIISFHGRQSTVSPAVDGRTRAFIAGYSVPILIPIGRSGSLGEIGGRVVDVEKNKGVGKALLNIGDATALTDDDGNFRFPGLPPGTYYLQVDRMSIGYGRVTTKPLPMEILLSGGGVSEFALGVVRSCSVTGSVILYGLSERMKADSLTPEIIELRGQPDIILQLSNGTEIIRRISDNQGRWTFTDIRPGRWVLTLLEGQLPENHYLEKDSYEIELRPGERKEAIFKIFPRHRAIRIIQEEKVIEEKKGTQKIKPSRPQQISPTQAPSLISYNKKRGGYVVQASSWRSRRRALAGIREAKLLIGKPAFLKRVRVPGIGLRYRVYVGSLKIREEAEAIEKMILSKK